MSSSSRPLAVITGASSGIGAEFARRLAREGYDLLVVARSATALRLLAEELTAKHPVAVEVHPADLTRPSDLATLATRMTEHLLRLDLVVNSAGAAPEGDLSDTDAEVLRSMIALNITAVTELSRSAIIRMRAAHSGAIINIGSGAAYQPLPHFAAYAASKAYVVRLTEALSEENRPFGIRIVAVSPGDTDTPMNPGEAPNKRKPQHVVETALSALRGAAPSVIDGRRNTVVATLATRVLPKRLALRTAERMMRSKM